MAEFLNKWEPVSQEILLEEIEKENWKDKTFPLTQPDETDKNKEAFHIYFDWQSLLDSLVELEEQDLFLINHVAEEEANLDEYSWRAEGKISRMNNELTDVKKNISELETSMRDLKEKEKVLKEMRDKTTVKPGQKV